MANNLLSGKKGIIFGALNDKSIAWKAAEKIAAEGGSIVLTNTPLAVRMGDTARLAERIGAPVIPADATDLNDLENLVDQAMTHFGGGFDFVLHAVGMSMNIRKGKKYEEADYPFFAKTLDISALSFHKLMGMLYKKHALKEYGSVVALSYLAADRAVEGYNDMADAKAMLQSVARNFGLIYGRRRHVRVNTISQSPTLTTAGSGIAGMQRMFGFTDEVSPLGNASAEDCAGLVTALFSDLTRKVTMQNLYNDGGFSMTVPGPFDH